MTSYSTLIETIRLSSTVFRVIARFSSKWLILTHPTCICRPCRGWSRSNFALVFGIRKLRVMELSCGVVCVILRLAVLIQYRSVTDTKTDRHTTTAYTALSIASCGKNWLTSVEDKSVVLKMQSGKYRSYNVIGLCHQHPPTYLVKIYKLLIHFNMLSHKIIRPSVTP